MDHVQIVARTLEPAGTVLELRNRSRWPLRPARRTVIVDARCSTPDGEAFAGLRALQPDPVDDTPEMSS
jgi:hypothetical protein